MFTVSMPNFMFVATTVH